MNEPTRLTNWDEFVELFGTASDSYTSDSVYGFFKNGGTDCWMVRIAHCAEKGVLPTIDHAACAEHVQIDDWNKPSLKIRALDEGEWGNTIWFRCIHTPGAQALLTRDLEAARRSARSLIESASDAMVIVDAVVRLLPGALGAEDGAGQVGVHRRPPVRHAQLLERDPRRADAGVVEQQVEPAEGVPGLREQGPHRLRILTQFTE